MMHLIYAPPSLSSSSSRCTQLCIVFPAPGPALGHCVTWHSDRHGEYALTCELFTAEVDGFFR